MDFLQNTDPGALLIIGVGLALLCVVGFVLIFVLQTVGNLLGIFTSIFGTVFDIVQGGPTSWCGCLVVIGGCFGCGAFALILSQMLSSCGTSQAVNFCRLFGR